MSRGTFISVTEDDLPELPEGQFYVRDLIGMKAVEENGNVLGYVTDVLQNTAQDIFEIEDDNGEKILIPKVDQFVLDIDSSKREITVRMIEGLRDL
ncbi:MAG: ribosome maturation factor RimM [Anaerovoracaceae bacterium]